MKVWKVFNTTCDDEELEELLNEFESRGAKIKEIINTSMWGYKIIYTVEDVMEADDVSN